MYNLGFSYLKHTENEAIYITKRYKYTDNHKYYRMIRFFNFQNRFKYIIKFIKIYTDSEKNHYPKNVKYDIFGIFIVIS